jgi:hypothetical protein
MPVITIPFDYDPGKYGDSLVPIFLNDTDVRGDQIFFGWIEAVVSVQDKLKEIARRVLSDVWRVSELTDITVHHLWEKHRDNVGPHPSYRIYKTALRKAHGIEDPGARAHLGLNLALDALEQYKLDALVSDSTDFENLYHRYLDLNRMEARIKGAAKRDEAESYRMLRSGYDWREISRAVGDNRNTVYRRFHRLLKKITDVV